MSGTFEIFDDGSGSYSLAEINIVTVKLKQGLFAYGYGPTFSLLGDDGNTYNFTNNIPNNNNTNNNNNNNNQNPFNNNGNYVPNNYPNFNEVIQYSGFTPATPTSNTVTYNTTSIILIISSIVFASYYYKIKYSQ